MNKNRLILFDILRAISTIWIVLIWHAKDYTTIYSYETIGGSITTSVLAAFVFTSGFFLGKKKLDAVHFYKNRFTRLMIPLLISCVILRLIDFIPSTRSVILTPIGLCCFVPPMPPTIWFIAMIILFYWVTPLLLYKTNDLDKKKKYKIIIVRAIVIFAVFILLRPNTKVLRYFPFYVIGILLTTENIKTMLKIKLPFKLLFLALWILITVMTRDIFAIPIGVLLLIWFSDYLTKCVKIKKIFTYISYSSMFAYLFHRAFYSLLAFLPYTSEWLRVAEIIAIGIGTFILSYFMQKGYDKIVTMSSLKHGNK
jgi:surface polysaccharide O-acyltransferase-like enzyme